jgi:hypothetical protein
MDVLQLAGFVVGGVSRPAGRSRQVSKKARTMLALRRMTPAASSPNREQRFQWIGVTIAVQFAAWPVWFSLVCVWPDRDHFSQGKHAPATAR